MYYDTTYIISLIVVYSIYAILLLLGGLNLYNIKKTQSMIDDLADEVHEMKRGLEDDRKSRVQQEIYNNIARQYGVQSNKDNFKN